MIRVFTAHQHLLSADKVSASAPPVLSTSQTTLMGNQINSVIQANPEMDIGVAIEDLNNGKSYHYVLSDAFIAASVQVYHKAGWLDDRVHDAAIIDNGKHPYVLVIFTKMDDGSSYDTTEGHQIFAGITSATVQAFIK